MRNLKESLLSGIDAVSASAEEEIGKYIEDVVCDAISAAVGVDIRYHRNFMPFDPVSKTITIGSMNKNHQYKLVVFSYKNKYYIVPQQFYRVNANAFAYEEINKGLKPINMEFSDIHFNLTSPEVKLVMNDNELLLKNVKPFDIHTTGRIEYLEIEKNLDIQSHSTLCLEAIAKQFKGVDITYLVIPEFILECKPNLIPRVPNVSYIIIRADSRGKSTFHTRDGGKISSDPRYICKHVDEYKSDIQAFFDNNPNIQNIYIEGLHEEYMDVKAALGGYVRKWLNLGHFIGG